MNAVQVGVTGQMDGLMWGHLAAHLVFRGVRRLLHRLEGISLHQDVIRLPVLREFAGVRPDCVLGSSLLVSDGSIRTDHLGVLG